MVQGECNTSKNNPFIQSFLQATIGLKKHFENKLKIYSQSNSIQEHPRKTDLSLRSTNKISQSTMTLKEDTITHMKGLPSSPSTPSGSPHYSPQPQFLWILPCCSSSIVRSRQHLPTVPSTPSRDETPSEQ